VGSFLEIAVQAAAGLIAVHQQDVVHKDIKPSNLVWNAATSVLKLIDFGISTRLREETRSELNSQQLTGRQRISEALGESAQVLIEAIPSLELLLGKQDSVAQGSAREARNRFHLLLRKLLAAIAREEHPLVLFLAGLEWADRATLELLTSLTAQEPLPFFLLVGAYHDDQVDAARSQRRTQNLAVAATSPVSS
jgi:predicted ATPase